MNKNQPKLKPQSQPNVNNPANKPSAGNTNQPENKTPPTKPLQEEKAKNRWESEGGKR